jgi:DNA-binding transcriptional LysR family regulator
VSVQGLPLQRKQSIQRSSQAQLDNRPMPLTRFTLRQLEAFISVGELHSFSGAAQRLAITPQAVSQQVAELEAVLGLRQAAETAASDLRHRAAGLVRVGAPLVLAATALPAAVKHYLTVQPKVSVRICDLTVESLVDSVASGDVDFAIGPDRAAGPEVHAQALFSSPWVLWCSPDHRLAQARVLRWADLRHQPLVAAGRDHERSVAQMRTSAPSGSRITPVDVVDNVSTALGIAAQGLAATLAPAYVGVLAKKLGLVMRRVTEPETVRQVCLYTPVARAQSPAAVGFAEHLVRWLPSWPAGSKPARPRSSG